MDVFPMQNVRVFVLLDTHDKDAIDYENEIDQIRTVIDQRRSDLIHLVENEKNNLLSKIDEYIQSNFAKYDGEKLRVVV